MTRAALAILLALIVPACNHDDGDEDHQVTVSNVGDEAAIVHITHERAEWLGGGDTFDSTYELAPGAQRTDIYPSTHEVSMVVLRKSDSLLLYAANFDIDDFDNHDERVWITINP